MSMWLNVIDSPSRPSPRRRGPSAAEHVRGALDGSNESISPFCKRLHHLVCVDGLEDDLLGLGRRAPPLVVAHQGQGAVGGVVVLVRPDPTGSARRSGSLGRFAWYAQPVFQKSATGLSAAVLLSLIAVMSAAPFRQRSSRPSRGNVGRHEVVRERLPVGGTGFLEHERERLVSGFALGMATSAQPLVLAA